MAEGSADEASLRAGREADFESFVQENLKRNYRANFVHGMLGLTGFRLIYAPTIIPAYVHLLTGSAAMVGVGQALLQLGAVLSPIIGAARIEHRKRILPYAIRVGTLMRVQVLGLALAGWFLAGLPLLIATMTFFFLLGIFTGTQRVAFQMLVAKVIPIRRRGRLQAWRNLTGGLIAAGLAYFAGRYFIEGDVLGNGYATTFFLAFVLTSLGLVVLQLLLVEPELPEVRAQMPFFERLREFPQLLADRDFAWFMVAQGLAVAGRAATPFYILYAGQHLGLDGSTIGLLSFAFLGADTLSNLLWGYLGDRVGFRLSFLVAILVWILAVMSLLSADSQAGFLISFIGLGAAASGYMMSALTMVLEFGSREDIPMRLALSATVEGAIAAAGPIAAGVLVVTLGYRPLIIVTLAFLACAFWVLLFRIREPRTRPDIAPRSPL